MNFRKVVDSVGTSAQSNSLHFTDSPGDVEKLHLEGEEDHHTTTTASAAATTAAIIFVDGERLTMSHFVRLYNENKMRNLCRNHHYINVMIRASEVVARYAAKSLAAGSRCRGRVVSC